MRQLRDWQEEAVDAFYAQRRGIVKASTGSGKTILGFGAAKRLEDQFVIVLVPSIRLLKQWYDEALNWYAPSQISRKGAKHNDNLRWVNIWTYDMARVAIPLLGPVSNCFLIVDECHRIGSPKSQAMVKHLNPHWCLGLSATPERADGIDVTKIIGPIVFEYDYKDGVRDGILREIEVICVGYEMNPEEQKEYDDYTQRKKNIEKKLGVISPSPPYMNQLKTDFLRSGKRDLAALCDLWQQVCIERKRALYEHETRHRIVMQWLTEKLRDRHILVVGESIPVVERLFDAVSHAGPNCNLTVGKEHSKLSHLYRTQTVSLFERNIINCLISARTLDQGADFPTCDAVVIHSGSSSVLQFIQRMGRGSRPEGAEVTIVVRPFAIGTPDDIAISGLIESNVLKREWIKIVGEDGLPLKESERPQAKPKRGTRIKLSLLSDGMIRAYRDGKAVFFENKFVDKMVREYKPRGGVFHWNPETNEVFVFYDQRMKQIGYAKLAIPEYKPREHVDIDWEELLS